jgi:hypothetical protein
MCVNRRNREPLRPLLNAQPLPVIDFSASNDSRPRLNPLVGGGASTDSTPRPLPPDRRGGMGPCLLLPILQWLPQRPITLPSLPLTPTTVELHPPYVAPSGTSTDDT